MQASQMSVATTRSYATSRCQTHPFLDLALGNSYFSLKRQVLDSTFLFYAFSLTIGPPQHSQDIDLASLNRAVSLLGQFASKSNVSNEAFKDAKAVEVYANLLTHGVTALSKAATCPVIQYVNRRSLRVAACLLTTGQASISFENHGESLRPGSDQRGPLRSSCI